MRDVFISYHTESAKTAVLEIAQLLESRGVSCWYAPRDCEDFWAEAIVKAIDAAAIFLILLNTQACHSDHVKNEMHLAHENRSLHKAKIVAFQLEGQCLSDPDVRYYLGRTHIINGITPPHEDRVMELVNRIVYMKEHPQQEAAVVTDGFTGTVITPPVGFVGRQQELTQLAQQLGTYKKVFVSGMGGMGKSELVRQFVFQNRDQYRCVLWGSYKGSLRELILDDEVVKLTDISRRMDEPDDSYFQRKCDYILHNGTYFVLLVVDNFDTENDPDLDVILKLPISILFTTRTYHFDSPFSYLRLEPMTMEDLFVLFQKGYPRAEEYKEDAIALIRAMGSHTLAVKLVSGYMREQRLKPAKMLDKLRDPQNAACGDIARSIYSLFAISGLTDEEKRILINLALIPLEGIAAEDFADAVDLDGYEALNALIGRSWILYDSARDYISLHPIISQLVLEQVGYSDVQCGNYVEFLTHQAASAKYVQSGKRSVLLSRVERLLSLLPATSDHYLPFYLACGELFHAFSKHDKTVSCLQAVADGDFDLYARVQAATDVADAYRCTHNFEMLLKKAQEAQKLCDLLDPNDPRSCRLQAELWGRFGWYHMGVGNYEEACRIFTQQLQAVLQYEADNPERIGWGYYNVAIAQTPLKQTKAAIENLAFARDQFARIGMDFALAVVCRQEGLLLLEVGDCTAATERMREALRLFTGVVGEQHNDVAVTMHHLAKLCLLSGNTEEAKRLEAQAFDYCKQSGYLNIITDWLF